MNSFWFVVGQDGTGSIYFGTEEQAEAYALEAANAVGGAYQVYRNDGMVLVSTIEPTIIPQ